MAAKAKANGKPATKPEDFKLNEKEKSAIGVMVKDLFAYDTMASNLKEARQTMAVHMAQTFNDKTDFLHYMAASAEWQEQYRAARKCDEVASRKAFSRALGLMNEHLRETQAQEFSIPKQTTKEAVRKQKDRDAADKRVKELARLPFETLVEMAKIGNSDAIRAQEVKQKEEKHAEDGAVKSKREVTIKGARDCVNPQALECANLCLQYPAQTDALFRALRLVGLDRQVGTMHGELVADAIVAIGAIAGNDETKRKVIAVADALRAKVDSTKGKRPAAPTVAAQAHAASKGDGATAP